MSLITILPKFVGLSVSFFTEEANAGSGLSAWFAMFQFLLLPTRVFDVFSRTEQAVKGS